MEVKERLVEKIKVTFFKQAFVKDLEALLKSTPPHTNQLVHNFYLVCKTCLDIYLPEIKLIVYLFELLLI